MAQEREIATKISALGEMLNIVSAIRAIAASQMQQALQSLEAIRGYSETIRGALSEAAALLPSDRIAAPVPEISNSGLIVFSAEHGLCGGFNEHLLHRAERVLEPGRQRVVLVVAGTRGGQIFRERGLKPDLVLPMATHCAGVTAAARRIATEVYRMFSDRKITALEVIYAQQAGNELAGVERRRLLPLEMPTLEARQPAVPPLVNLNPRRLFDDIAGE
ncbi:MAG TPA: FoF1 ATP synthase subunit gamma, partial [Candidatus Binataceae bacterium]|nr:FoF1 ATP synthase subunit gamma [Candidatus Binataceae bacterium]